MIVWFSELEFISIRYFETVRNLHEINLQDNLIKSLPEDTFNLNKELRSLNLGSNQIEKLPTRLLWNLAKLEGFVAERNKIEFLSTDLFRNNTNLQFINLNNNKIKEIGIDFTNMSNIKILGMGNVCANFYLTKKFNGTELNKLVKDKCSFKNATVTKN